MSPAGDPTETVVEPASAPPDPFAGLTDAPSAHVSHELEESYATPALPSVSSAFGEEDAPFEIPPVSAPAPINATDVQAQHTVPSGSPPMLPIHQVDAETPIEAPLPSIAPYDSPADMDMTQGPIHQLPPIRPYGSPDVHVPPIHPYDSPTDMDMIQGPSRLTSIGAASVTSSDIEAQRPSSPSHLIPQGSAPDVSYLTGSPYASAPPLPTPPPASYVQVSRPPLPPPPPEPSPPPELTPGLIAKAQKHCRFAISSLDYEDVQQARKELYAALAILGR